SGLPRRHGDPTAPFAGAMRGRSWTKIRRMQSDKPLTRDNSIVRGDSIGTGVRAKTTSLLSLILIEVPWPSLILVTALAPGTFSQGLHVRMHIFFQQLHLLLQPVEFQSETPVGRFQLQHFGIFRRNGSAIDLEAVELLLQSLQLRLCVLDLFLQKLV